MNSFKFLIIAIPAAIFSIMLTLTSCTEQEADVTTDYITYLKTQKAEPFNNMSTKVFDHLKTNAIFDDEGNFRGMTNVSYVSEPLGADRFQLAIAKLTKEADINTTMSDFVTIEARRRPGPYTNNHHCRPVNNNGNWSCAHMDDAYCVDATSASCGTAQ